MQIDELVRSRRKTLSLEIDQEAKLIIRAPDRMHMEQIFRFLKEKEQWIYKKKEQVKHRKRSVEKKAFLAGEKFLFLGQEYMLELVHGASETLELFGTFRLAEEYLPRAKEVFEQWYKNEAKVILTEKTEIMAERIGVRVQQVKINSAQKRWGSCTSSGNINYSWRLVLAPEYVVDYVVAHEVAHRKQMNHSKRFWEVVEFLYPEYRSAKKWLKEKGHAIGM